MGVGGGGGQRAVSVETSEQGSQSTELGQIGGSQAEWSLKRKLANYQTQKMLTLQRSEWEIKIIMKWASTNISAPLFL